MAACTIISKNYLAHARVLAASFGAHHPGVPFFVLLSDTVDGCFDPADEPFELVLLDELPIPNLPRFCFQYSIVELNTAAKPYFLAYLLERHGLEKVLYLDPDIQVMASLGQVYDLLDSHAVVLTPHLTAPLPDDGRKPGELDILQAGTYNLGFIAIAAGPTAARLLSWWQARLYDRCRVDLEHGMHVDQRWIDLVPGFFDDVAILRDEGYNVAYWNLPSRQVVVRDGHALVNGRPVRFMHFSGIDPRQPHVVSRHDARLTIEDLGDAAALFDRYRALLLEHGYDEAMRWPYRYRAFDNGIPIPPVARALYLDLGAEVEQFGNPFHTGTEHSYAKWLLQGVDGAPRSESSISRLLDGIYRRRPDLQQVYPRPAGADRNRFLRWVSHFGRDECDLDLRLVPELADYPGEQASGLAVSVEPGINVCGFVASEKGIGQAARSLIRAVRVAGVPHTINPCVDTMSANEETSPGRTSEDNPYAVNLLVLGLADIPDLVRTRPPGYFDGRHNVIHVAWELAGAPPDLVEHLQRFDEIWAASDFVARSLAPLTPVPVTRVPYPVPDDAPLNLWHPFHFGIPKGVFVFLCMFDASSGVERKNPEGVIRAFTSAFSPDDPALLIVKCARAIERVGALKAMQAAGAGANVRLVDSVLSRQQVNTLLYLSDCYVSLHRAEGFGLPIAEAMLMQKPVIATGYSGNMDFMNEANSFPIRYRLAELERDHGPYRRGSVWAEPDLGHAAEMMRHVFEHRDEARGVGARGRRTIVDEYGVQRVGGLIAGRLAPWIEPAGRA
jgi:glycosyltransferase involved in cell wall biosynthesis